MLTNASFNALLKTSRSPRPRRVHPGHDRAGEDPGDDRPRCQRFRFRALALEDRRRARVDRHGREGEGRAGGLVLIAKASGGASCATPCRSWTRRWLSPTGKVTAATVAGLLGAPARGHFACLERRGPSSAARTPPALARELARVEEDGLTRRALQGPANASKGSIWRSLGPRRGADAGPGWAELVGHPPETLSFIKRLNGTLGGPARLSRHAPAGLRAGRLRPARIGLRPARLGPAPGVLGAPTRRGRAGASALRLRLRLRPGFFRARPRLGPRPA